MIGARLKLARAAAGLSRRELEDGLQGPVTAQAIGKYERDEMMPSWKRLNKKALDADEEKPTGGSDSVKRVLGDHTRHRGSLHCDIWEGTAEDLAARNVIGIYPVSGWWKEQPKRDRSDTGGAADRSADRDRNMSVSPG